MDVLLPTVFLPELTIRQFSPLAIDAAGSNPHTINESLIWRRLAIRPATAADRTSGLWTAAGRRALPLLRQRMPVRVSTNSSFLSNLSLAMLGTTPALFSMEMRRARFGGSMTHIATALDWVFGCHHSNLSRVFTIRGRSYVVCCDCGAEFRYSFETMSIQQRELPDSAPRLCQTFRLKSAS